MRKCKVLILTTLIMLILGGCAFASESSQTTQQIYDDIMQKGWITKEEFDAESNLTRRQAIKTIMRMAGDLPDTSEHLPDFDDTANDPDRDIFLKARNYGIIEGSKSNKLSPDKEISKMMLVTWMDRVFDLPNTVNFENHEAKDNEKKVDPEAYYAINKYLEHNIITPDEDGRIRPRSTITVGEFAFVIDRLSGVGIRDLKGIKKEGETQTEQIIDPH